MHRIGTAACLLAFVAAANVARAQSVTTEKSTKWGPAPAALPAGAKAAVLDGDPSKSGEFTLRLNFPPGYRIPPHFHPTSENATIISGTFNLGMGDQFDKKKASALHAGTFGVIPANMHHYAWTTGRTVVQIHGMGPFKLTYVNPADTPKPR
jgi:quercetin dioxygenase-like cupin family protein